MNTVFFGLFVRDGWVVRKVFGNTRDYYALAIERFRSASKGVHLLRESHVELSKKIGMRVTSDAR